MSWGSLVI